MGGGGGGGHSKEQGLYPLLTKQNSSSETYSPVRTTKHKERLNTNAFDRVFVRRKKRERERENNERRRKKELM